MMHDMGDEDALLQQALAMSMAESQAQPDEKDDSKPEAESTMMDAVDDENAEMQMALRMSLQENQGESAETSSQQQQFQDPQFVTQLLGSLPGVDQNNPEIRNALENLSKSNQERDDKKDNE